MRRIRVSAKFKEFLTAKGVDISNQNEITPVMHAYKQTMIGSSPEEIARHNADVELKKRQKKERKNGKESNPNSSIP